MMTALWEQPVGPLKAEVAFLPPHVYYAGSILGDT